MRFLLLSLFPALLSAAEPLAFEVRLTGGLIPGVSDLDTTISGPGGSTQVYIQTDSKLGFAIEPQVVASQKLTEWIGLSGCIGLFYRQHAGETPNTNETLTIAAGGLTIAPALNFYVIHKIQLEVGPTIGIGIGRRTIRINGKEDPNYPDGSGVYYSFGGRVGAYTQLTSHVVAGLDVGYIAFTNNDDVQVSTVTLDSEVTGAGFFAHIGIGYRF